MFSRKSEESWNLKKINIAQTTILSLVYFKCEKENKKNIKLCTDGGRTLFLYLCLCLCLFLCFCLCLCLSFCFQHEYWAPKCECCSRGRTGRDTVQCRQDGARRFTYWCIFSFFFVSWNTKYIDSPTSVFYSLSTRWSTYSHTVVFFSLFLNIQIHVM